MKTILSSIIRRPLSILLLALPLAIAARYLNWGSLWIFVLSAIAIIPLAYFIGEGTEALAARTNPRIGGLLNATLGNAAELIITIIAIREGLLELVKASIAGSILGNLLLVMGLSMLVGGVRHGIQSFDRRQASRKQVPERHRVADDVVGLRQPLLEAVHEQLGPPGHQAIPQVRQGVVRHRDRGPGP